MLVVVLLLCAQRERERERERESRGGMLKQSAHSEKQLGQLLKQLIANVEQRRVEDLRTLDEISQCVLGFRYLSVCFVCVLW